ncbi:E3 ubiquitin-protein ligase RNF170-like [Macadamia integrifolia]|uniref:E3 ubiquitin-protein ligase RNF170-like n=1 Tax=Macadamia integrifolia TaxID=60698 RepID=UPI001C4F9AAF|nr:E3 ubiquitin-protein ligase RNF170-like [Macadamia integrifolia]
MEGPPENDCCSICHDSFNIPCQANCSHWFCGNCILRVWHHGSALSPCKCPICRDIVTLLIPREASSQHHHDPEVRKVLKNIQRYNLSFGGGTPGLIQRLQDLPFFLWRLLRELADPQISLPLFARLRMILPMLMTAIYMLSPINIIPKGIAGFIGKLDDIAIALILFLHVAAMYRSARLSRRGGS